MTWFTTLNTPEILHLGICVVACPHFQTPSFLVPIHRALVALNYIALSAEISYMSSLVALEAKLLIAIKRVVSVLPAQNAIQSFSLIWAFLSPMSVL